MQRNTIIILFLSLFLPSLLWCQSKSEITAIIHSLELQEDSTNHSKDIDEPDFRNEYQLVLSGAFHFYKNYISSQDASHCSFTPSCSEYAIIAIQNQGIFIGILNFFDRFSRCNSLSPENYEKNPHNHLLIDPVRDLHYEKVN